MKHRKSLFGYIRVSTPKQGERGYSLDEQRDDIQAYADRHGLQIVQWFMEKKTAAKRGRPQFNAMLQALRRGRAHGVVIHKIDRSARNPGDWGDLGELVDKGVEVHFAHDGFSLNTRSTRLTADILAVVAADYIRNLREEAIKGLRGCMKKGLYPRPAPIGYLNRGPGNPKEPDPAQAPLVRQVFELYATGRYSFKPLLEEAHALGLRNLYGNKLDVNSLTAMLNNPFYTGIIKVKRTGATFPGAHEPIISVDLFERVQKILRTRYHTKQIKHGHLFRRMLRCACGYNLIGERQKGHVYYRCHTKPCPTKCIREQVVREAWHRELSRLVLNATERAYVAGRIDEIRRDWDRQRQAVVEALRIQRGQLDARLDRLINGYVEGLIDKNVFQQKKQQLLLEVKKLDQGISEPQQAGQVIGHLEQFLAFIQEAKLLYRACAPDERREFIETVTSNRVVEGEKVMFMLSEPFLSVAERRNLMYGREKPDIPRMWDALLNEILAYFSTHPQTYNLTAFINRVTLRTDGSETAIPGFQS